MRRGPRSWLLPAGGLVLFAVFVGLAWMAREGAWLASWDAHVTDAFMAWRSSGWTRAFWILTLLGDDSLVAPLTAAVVMLLWVWGRNVRATLLAGGMAAGWVVINLSKATVARARPPADFALVESPSSYSMPSGHALIAVVLCGLLAYAVVWPHVSRWGAGMAGEPGRLGRARLRRAAAGATVVLGATLVTAGVGVSRVYLGVHWMSDVFAGWCLGGAVLAVTLAIAARWARTGGPHLVSSARPWGRKSRAALVVILAAVMVAAAALTVWVEPLG